MTGQRIAPLGVQLLDASRKRFSALVRSLAAALVLVISLLLSLAAVRAWRGDPPPSASPPAYPTGRHLIAYVLVSSTCGFCAEPRTKEAISQIRASLRATATGYAKVSVVGVALDPDLRMGIEYLEQLRSTAPVFDEISVGGGWGNEFLTQLVWRAGFARAATPTVVVVERQVDGTLYPGQVEIAKDSLVRHVAGRTELLAWLREGTPLRGAGTDSPSVRTP